MTELAVFPWKILVIFFFNILSAKLKTSYEKGRSALSCTGIVSRFESSQTKIQHFLENNNYNVDLNFVYYLVYLQVNLFTKAKTISLFNV